MDGSVRGESPVPGPTRAQAAKQHIAAPDDEEGKVRELWTRFLGFRCPGS